MSDDRVDVASDLIYTVIQKHATLVLDITLANVGRLKNSFTAGFCNKIAARSLLYFPLHVN